MSISNMLVFTPYDSGSRGRASFLKTWLKKEGKNPEKCDHIVWGVNICNNCINYYLINCFYILLNFYNIIRYCILNLYLHI